MVKRADLAAVVSRHAAAVGRALDDLGATEDEREIVIQVLVLRLAERELSGAAEAFFAAVDRVTFARADLDRRADALVLALRARAAHRAGAVGDDGIDW